VLKECLEVFERKMEEHEEPDDIILEGYIPADGTYVVVKTDGSITHNEIKFDKKAKRLETIPHNYEDLKFYDYHSRLLSIDKPQDPKKIVHSNNYLSFWVKKENFRNGKFNEEAIDRYFQAVKAPLEKYKKVQEIVLYKEVEKEIGVVDEMIVEKHRKWIIENIFDLEMQGIPIHNNDYLKIFFEVPREMYILEEKRYLYVKLFNNNDYNLRVKDQIIGLPGDNLGYNSKKPYLEQRSRKISVSTLLSKKETLLQKKFFEYLMNQVTIGKNNIYVDLEYKMISAKEKGELPDSNFAGLFLQIQKGTEVKILYQDNIVAYKSTLQPPFYFENILGGKAEDEYKIYSEKRDLQRIINDIFFSNYLILNYFTAPEDLSISDADVKRNILKIRGAIFAWLYKGQFYEIEKILWKTGIDLAKNSIKKGYLLKAVKQFNLAISFRKHYEGGESMKYSYEDINKNLRQKMNEESENAEWKIESDREYFFAVGQLIKYLLSLSKANDKMHSLANPFFNMKDQQQLKNKLQQMFKKYNYVIKLGSKRFDRLYAMVWKYELENVMDGDEIIAGYLSSNLIYEKLKEDINNE